MIYTKEYQLIDGPQGEDRKVWLAGGVLPNSLCKKYKFDIYIYESLLCASAIRYVGMNNYIITVDHIILSLTSFTASARADTRKVL